MKKQFLRGLLFLCIQRGAWEISRENDYICTIQNKFP